MSDVVDGIAEGIDKESRCTVNVLIHYETFVTFNAQINRQEAKTEPDEFKFRRR